MAQRVLHDGAELAEGAVVFGDQEERVIAEAARAAFLADDDTVAASLDDGLYIPAGVSKHGGAHVIGAALIIGDLVEFRQELGVIRGVIALRAGVTRRVNAR